MRTVITNYSAFTITINGYWKHDGRPIENYKVAIGWDGYRNDEIFFSVPMMSVELFKLKYGADSSECWVCTAVTNTEKVDVTAVLEHGEDCEDGEEHISESARSEYAKAMAYFRSSAFDEIRSTDDVEELFLGAPMSEFDIDQPLLDQLASDFETGLILRFTPAVNENVTKWLNEILNASEEGSFLPRHERIEYAIENLRIMFNL